MYARGPIANWKMQDPNSRILPVCTPVIHLFFRNQTCTGTLEFVAGVIDMKSFAEESIFQPYE